MPIRKVGNRWQVRVSIGNRQRLERTLPPGASRDDARQLEAQVSRAQIDAAIGKKPRYLIDDVLDQWQKTGAEKLKSWPKSLKYRFQVLRDSYTQGQRLDQLVEVAERIKSDGQRDGINPITVNRYVAILRRCGNLAEQWGWTDLSIGRRVKLLPENSSRHVYLTPEAVESIASKADPLVADMIRFAALTGLRRGEMLPLRPEQIRDGLVILGTDTKTGKPRGVPLTPQAAQIAAKRLPWGIGEYVLWERFVKARTAAGQPQVRWHDLRHTYGSWLMVGGLEPVKVRDLMGHSSLAVTNRYSHTSPEHLMGALKVLPTLGLRGYGVGKKNAKKPVRSKKKAA